MLAYVQDEDGSERSFFGAGEFDERLEEYDRMETLEDPFLSEATRKFAYYVSFWYMGKVTDESEFKELEAFDTRTEEEKEKEASLIKEVIERDAKIASDAQDKITDLVLKTREEQEKLEEEDAKIEAEIKEIDEEGERIRAEAMEGPEESPPEGNQEGTEANDSESKEAE
jgi:transposase